MANRAEGRVSLYSLATWINGLAFKSISFSEAGMPVIKISEVKNGLTSQTKFTDGSYDLKFLVEPGAMIFCWSGQPETSIGTFYWRGPRGWLNQHLFKVIPDSEQVDPEYFYFLMQDLKPLFVQLARNKQTTGLGHVTKQDLIRTEVALPPLDEQRRIAEVLGALDDLIDTNERLADRLWSSAEAVFERTQNIATTQMALGEVIELRYGKALPADSRRPGSVPVVSSAGISGAHDTALVEGPGVVVGRKGSVGSVTWVDADFFPIDTAFYVHRDRVPMSWAFFLLQSLPLDTMNTDSAVPGLNRANALALRVLVPDSDTLHDFDVVASELIGGARVLRAENEQLRRTRDELLPLLMSGAVRVRSEGVAA
jgi:type I restriction enzyme, S subunit